MRKHKMEAARDLAANEVLRFPNYVAWSAFNPVARAMVGASDADKRNAYEAAFGEVLEKVAKAMGAKP